MKCNLTIHNKQQIFLGYKIIFSHNKFTVKIPNSRSRYYLVGHSTTTKNNKFPNFFRSKPKSDTSLR